jgi:tetratricopeptide (TPR) repeat protein
MPAKTHREFDKGVNLLLNGDAQASLEHFLRTIEQCPRYYGAYHNLALAYLRLGQSEAAAKNFQKVIDLTNSAYAPSLYGLAMILYRNNELVESESLIRRALLLERTASGIYCLGRIQLALGRLSDAERSAREAIELDPAMGDSYFLLARIHEAQKNLSATIDDIRTYFRLSPTAT